MTETDKLSREKIVRATQNGNTFFAQLAVQLLDTMRELEYYKKLSMDLSNGTAQSSGGLQGPLYPNKESEVRNNCHDCGWNHPIDACIKTSEA